MSGFDSDGSSRLNLASAIWACSDMVGFSRSSNWWWKILRRLRSGSLVSGSSINLLTMGESLMSAMDFRGVQVGGVGWDVGGDITGVSGSVGCWEFVEESAAVCIVNIHSSKMAAKGKNFIVY